MPLHDRVAPASALASISDSALLPFKVDNRKHMFVYRDKEGRIHYLFLRIDMSRKGSWVDKPGNSGASTSRRVRGKSDLQPSVGSATFKRGSSKNAPPMLVLVAHGLDEPSTEITRDLRAMLEGKLSATALTRISNLIARNPTFQLTRSDVAFVVRAGRGL